MTREEFKNLTKAEKNEARRELWNIVKTGVSEKKDAMQALKVLRPSLYGISIGVRGGDPLYKRFGNLFEKKGDMIEELDMFTELKIGRKVCLSLIKDNIRKADPISSRKWISFDVESEVYTLKGIGEKSPKDWTGYLPVEDVDIDELK